jgi:hypothetical protein
MSAQEGEGGQVWGQRGWPASRGPRQSLPPSQIVANRALWAPGPQQPSRDKCRPPAPIPGRGTTEEPLLVWTGPPTFAHRRPGGFEPVARVAVALVVTGKVDAEATVAAQVGFGALVQV